jgi:hypothetical protein
MVALLDPQRADDSHPNITVYLPISGEALVSLDPATAARLYGTSHELIELHISTHERRNVVIGRRGFAGARGTVEAAPFEPAPKQV